MSLFDFPRINFSGHVDINVPTINNAYYFPLTLYDAVRSEPFLPPRLYFPTYNDAAGVESNLNPPPPILHDDMNVYYYIEVATINTIEILREWCMTPIVDEESNKFDRDYIPYYKAAVAAFGIGIDMMGKAPGYWNMFGDMGVYFSQTKVSGVQTLDENNEVQTWANGSTNIPQDVLTFLNASFDTDGQPGAGNATSLMVETVSNQSVYANIFCSNVNLYNTQNPENMLLNGTPYRFSASIYNAWRVLNWVPPMAGSARFCSSIPMDELDESASSQLIKFFNDHNKDGRDIKGVFVSFVVMEVFENRYNQNYYLERKAKNLPMRNPGRSTTIGTIAPWYEGDMIAGLGGRNLISMGMSTVTASPPLTLAPAVSQLKEMDDNTAIFSVDMGNTLPEEISPPFDPNNPPAFRKDASFETWKLGTLSFRYSDDPATEFASIQADPTNFPRENVFQMGGVFDFTLSEDYLKTHNINESYSDLIDKIKGNYIQVYLKTDSGEKQVLIESPYMITTDYKGIYANQGDDPADGYYSFSDKKEPVVLRIFERGVPVTEPISVGIAQYNVPEASNDPMGGYSSLRWVSMKDKSIVQLSETGLELNDNAIYYFVYENQYPNNEVPDFVVNNNYTIMDTGSFLVLRVHHFKDFSQYTNPTNWANTPPTYEVVYENVFKLYDVVYPIMAHVHPFTKQVWNDGTMAGKVLERTDMSLWNNIDYMPRSRELSASQRALLEAWANYLNSNTNDE